MDTGVTMPFIIYSSSSEIYHFGEIILLNTQNFLCLLKFYLSIMGLTKREAEKIKTNFRGHLDQAFYAVHLNPTEVDGITIFLTDRRNSINIKINNFSQGSLN